MRDGCVCLSLGPPATLTRDKGPKGVLWAKGAGERRTKNVKDAPIV